LLRICADRIHAVDEELQHALNGMRWTPVDWLEAAVTWHAILQLNLKNLPVFNKSADDLQIGEFNTAFIYSFASRLSERLVQTMLVC
jgi:hypothetical protein